MAERILNTIPTDKLRKLDFMLGECGGAEMKFLRGAYVAQGASPGVMGGSRH